MQLLDYSSFSLASQSKEILAGFIYALVLPAKPVSLLFN